MRSIVASVQVRGMGMSNSLPLILKIYRNGSDLLSAQISQRTDDIFISILITFIEVKTNHLCSI